MYKVFIDGATGTTGLNIRQRLQNRDDIRLINIDENDKYNINKRAELICESDVSFLCLADENAIEIANEVKGADSIIIDASTAHRTNKDWTYGFSELGSEFENRIQNSTRIANPGCHASGIIALIYPLIKENIISKDILLSAVSITGYSGGGKKMIKEYEENKDNPATIYALLQSHKHIPEILNITGLVNAPNFIPIIDNNYEEMVVNIPIFRKLLNNDFTKENVIDIYKKYYSDKIVSYIDMTGMPNIQANKLTGKDIMNISVVGSEDNFNLIAIYDNLGKGAAGAAIENMNIALGIDKTKGLILD